MISDRFRMLRDDERGWALVTAIIVISLMMAVGLAVMSRADTQTNLSLKERTRESSFNLSEAALQAQGYLLGPNWPGTSAAQIPDCASSDPNLATKICPSPASLSGTAGNGSFNLADFKASTGWTVKVRDNGTPPSDFYSASVMSNPSWDANGDGKLWVWAQSLVRGKPRTVVALLKREKLNEPFPRTAITAGHASAFTGQAAKTLINGTGSQIVVRCTDPPGNGSSCLEYKDPQQIIGQVVQAPSTPPAMDAGQLQRFIDMAKSAGTYYTSCSNDASLVKAPVTVFDPPAGTTTCLRYTGSSDIFSQAQPGILILTRGKFYCSGNIDMYGVLYLPNLDNRSDDDMVDVNGNCQIRGSVSVDGNGGITAGQSGGNAKDGNIVYDPNAFSSLYTFGTAGLVQNTWRELPPLG